ncbi:MAG: PAS domain S-box protein [Bacteroidetes bacterium]|nr:PAS domain S-box protein [Bacteroidota bacterium]MBU1371475.1 PAS domain S-box protein [Bacteroidota bacterium]MBU1485705.1 PAS domain S-box protein [Bacteroidota bacterium]MBU1759504.1 PAS domain S-box protein [Bacteroidota bacterium]MBU2045848.1 PAS domain S-box protein [Bacteroidota bacterium]
MNKLIEKIRYKYLYFLLLVVALIFSNQAILQYSLSLQKEGAQIINQSGRQRMLSQRISKLVLFINYNHSISHLKYNLDSLNFLVNQWESSNNALVKKNQIDQNSEIESLLKINSPRLESIVGACRKISKNPSENVIDSSINIIKKNELPFLMTMEETVNTYQKLAENKLNNLKILEMILSIISVIILISTFLLYVIPVIKELIKRGNDLNEANLLLIASEEEVKANLEELKTLGAEIEFKDQNNKIFIEQAPGAIAMFDDNMNYLAASQNWITDYNLQNQNIIGKSHYEIFPEIGDDWKKIHQECLAGSINISSEAPFKRADGYTQWLSWEVKPWHTAENKIGGIIMYTNDITAIKEKEAEQYRIQKILEKTNEISRTGTWEVDLVNNKIIWSKVTKEIHEVSPDFEPDLATAIDFFKEGNSKKTITEVVNEAIVHVSPYDVELEIITAKNRIVWVRAIGQAEIIDGKCIRLYGVFQDINELKLAEEKIIRTNTELNAILNSGPISIITTDMNGLITHFNKGAEQLLQYTANEMIGKLTPAVIHLEEEVTNRGKELTEQYGKEISGFNVFVEKAKRGEYESRQWTYIKKDGTQFPVELLVTALINLKNEITGFLGVGTDISARIASEKEILDAKNSLELLTKKLTKQNNQLASFAHITSHNLRSPVSNLNSLLYFYNNSESMEDKAELFEKFEIVIKHLTSTLNTLVDTLKIKEETNHEIEKLVFDDLLNKTKEILSGQIIETQAHITSDFSKAQKINYSRTYLESIFLNLISNAIKYQSPERALKIHLETIHQNGKTELIITDNGLGIDMDKHGSKLFGLNKTFHRHAEAKGIGLYLTKTQIESMGGNISAKSKVNEGTSFIVTF